MMDLEPTVVFEDESILIVDKPAGLIVNKADTSKGQPTLQEWVENRLRIINPNPSLENDFYLRSGIVHRLDKETSGLMIIAKDEASFLNLQKQFKDHNVSKTYEALVHGKVVPEIGEVNVPVGRLPWDRKKFGIVADGKEATTHYKVLRSYNYKKKRGEETLTLIEAYPKTGRTHQIRVHFRYLGFPIFADSLYAGRKTLRDDRKLLPRHFLHAKSLKFNHPKSGAELSFKSALPSELVDFLSILK